MTNEASRGSRFRFAPILTATVLTVLGIWLFTTVAHVFVLLMLGVLLSLYLGALSNWIQRKTRAPEGVALLSAIVGSLAMLALLVWILAPPVIEQTRMLIEQMPTFIASWERGIDNLAANVPALRDIVGPPGEHRTMHALYEQVSGVASGIPTKIFEIVHAAINVFAVGVMGIYLALHPALYREWLIALFPPIHRDLVRDVLHDLGDSLRSYIVGQILAMTLLGILTAIGLYVLAVPFSLPFGIFTGLVAIIPFFGTLVSTTLPALFVLTGNGYFGFSPLGHALLVVGLGVVVHLFEGNVVAPLVMSKKVDLPPVLTILSVLVIGKLLGGLGLIIAVPTLATLMVIVRRILITRIYEGQGFRRTARERPLILRVPAPGGGVLAHPGAPTDIISGAERAGLTRSA